MNITEQAYLVDALTKTKGSLKEASELAGLSLKTLQRKMRRYGLKPKDFRGISPSES
jgi:transcriptional regulator of acetoin/glycerol metabolism